MQFSILGPVEAVDGDGPLPLGGPRQRALLAFLLVNANRVVAADRLVEELWSTPPRDGHAALQNQVSRLRKVLGDRLVTQSPGYLLRVGDGELDLDRFRALVAAAGMSADASETSRLLREADALFRGAPFAEIDAPFVPPEAAALDELRLAAVEARIDADLARGRQAELVPELASLVARHPLRERLRGQYILALYRCGRQAEALDAYRETRRMLDEELGLEPSPALRELERAILRHDPSLARERIDDEPQRPPVPTRRSRRRAVLVAVALGAVAAAGGGAAVLLMRDTAAKPEPRVAAPVRAAHSPERSTARTVVRAARATSRRAAPARTPKRATHARRHAPRTIAAPRASTHVAVTSPPAPAASEPKPKPKPAATTTAAHAPANVTPTVTTVTPTPVPSDWRMLSDDFDGATTNWALWQPNTSGTGTSYAQQNGRLELQLDADGTPGGQYNMISTGLFVSRCKIEGDFDVRVDYTLLQWPPASQARVQLSAWTLPSGGMDAARTTTQYGEWYAGDFVGPTWNTVPTDDASGTLRVTRHDGLFASYYLQKSGKWYTLLTGRSTDEVTIGLELFAGGSDWAHKTVRAAFDNFAVAAPSFNCG